MENTPNYLLSCIQMVFHAFSKLIFIFEDMWIDLPNVIDGTTRINIFEYAIYTISIGLFIGLIAGLIRKDAH